MYCSKCAAVVADNASFCPACGAPTLPGNSAPYAFPTRPGAAGTDWLTTLLLCLFLGKLGVHRFYTGHTVTGLLMLFTLGGCGIWWLIDLVFILTESFKDSDGRALVKRN